jgi:hypothetical protein
MRDAGVDVETAANQAGQDVRVTLSIYSHVAENRVIKAAKLREGLFDIDIAAHPSFTQNEENQDE